MLIATLLRIPIAKATNAMRLIGFGPVQRSMGGASVGLPLDSATTITNPAGISKVGRRVDLGATFLAPDVHYKAVSSLGQIANNGRTIHSGEEPHIIPAIGMVLPIDDRVTVGAGAYGISGIGVDYEENLYNNITITNYGFLKLAPAFAYSFNDSFSIGIAPNIDYAAMNFEAGTTTQVAHDDGNAYGLGFTAGMLYDAADFLSFGLAYESRQWFTDLKFDTVRGEDKLSFDQPQNIAAGIGIRPNKKFRIAADVVWIDWSQTNGNSKPAYTGNSSGASAWNLNWNDQFVYKVGAEYDIVDKVKVRAGYNYGKNPLDSDRPFENISVPAIAEHHITCGATLALSEDVELNIGFMYAPRTSFDTANAVGQFINSADTDMSQYSIDAGLTHKF